MYSYAMYTKPLREEQQVGYVSVFLHIGKSVWVNVETLGLCQTNVTNQLIFFWWAYLAELANSGELMWCPVLRRVPSDILEAIFLPLLIMPVMHD